MIKKGNSHFTQAAGFILLFFLSLFFYGTSWAQISTAQTIRSEIQISPALENAQSISFNNLGIDQTGRGTTIISFFLENTSSETEPFLFLDFTLSNSKGKLASVYSKNSTPFSLSANQTVFITNNDLANDQLPGALAPVKLTGELTPEGRAFINSLEGSSQLPVGIYTIVVAVYKNNNRLNGGLLVSTSTAQIEVGAAGQIRDIFLKAPGDVIGNDSEISNPLPEFSWDGEPNVSYRIIVVKANTLDSPEALIQSAQSTNATNSKSGSSGSLLEFEQLDRIVTGLNFQYPVSGAQPLLPGNTYYWRVLGQITGAGGVQEVASEIWSFSMANMSSSTAGLALNREMRRTIIELLGQEKYNRLIASGFKLESIVVDGAEFSGPAMAPVLEAMLQKILDEKIVVERN